MKKSKLAALVAGALVLGLTVGSLGIANAAMRTTPASRRAAAMQARVYAATMRGMSPVATLARLTGLTVPQIMQARATGESFAQIAAANGVDPSTLVAQMLASRTARLDALVAAGKLTAAQEQAILARMTAAFTAMVGRTPGSMMTSGTVAPGGMMTSGTVDPTGTMTPGTPGVPMGPGAGSGVTTMTPGTPWGQGTGSGTTTCTPGVPAGSGAYTGPGTMTPGAGSGTMTPGYGMTTGTAAPHSGPGMM